MNSSAKRMAALCSAVILSAAAMRELSTLPIAAASGVCLNEVCTKNSVLAAPDGGFYDYIELYNAGNTSISLEGYGLSDDSENPFAFQFPSGTAIAAKGFLTVYCGVDTPADGFLAAPFGLSKNGEILTLSTKTGIVESLEVPPIEEDTAYGRCPDGSEQFAVLSELTAGKSNPSSAASEIVVTKPAFSKSSGFFAESFELTLSAPEGCSIFFTTDGSDPTPESSRYEEPISVFDISSEPNIYSNERDIADGYTPPKNPVDKAMIVRAIAVDAEGRTSDIATNSYFIGYTDDDFITQMRVISLVTDPDNLFDYEKGIYVFGKVYDDWKASPEYDRAARSWEIPANFTQSGKEWERPASMTVFEAGTATYSADIGIRVHGGATRSAAQKSFNLYARSDYGVSKLEYDFFDGTLISEATGKVIDSFDSLSLRNGGNDETTKLRDRLNHEAVSDRDIGTLAQTECVVFLDGEFWGCYNLMEKQSKDYIADHYDVKAGDVCLIKTDELSDGSEQGYADYEMLKEFAKTSDFSKPEVYEEFCTLVDAQSFADYMATEMIIGNSDFGDNNYCLWKTEKIKENKPYADGKWRFVLFDSEYGQGLYGQSNSGSSTFNTLKQKNCWLSKLFFGLLENNAEWRKMFVTTYFDLCNQNFNPNAMTSRISELIDTYVSPMAETYERFSMVNTSTWGGHKQPGQQQTQPTVDYATPYRNNVSSITNFWKQRQSNAKSILVNFLGNRVQNQKCSINVISNPSQGSVYCNTLTIDDETWNGDYLTMYPIALNAEGKDGYQFAGWKITCAEFVSGNELTANALIQAVESSVTVEAVYQRGTGLSPLDVRSLQQYLLNAGKLTTTQAAAYDLDSDTKLTVRDLALLKRIILAGS